MGAVEPGRRAGEELTPETFAAYVGGDRERPPLRLDAAVVRHGARRPYVAVCNSIVTATQWDGETCVPVRETFSGVDLVAGTELKPGP